MSVPEVPAIVERAYALAGPLTRYDNDETNWPVLVLLCGLLAADQDLWALFEDPGLAETLSPETCDPQWLEYLRAINGARLEESMTTEQRRIEVRHPSGWARGMPTTIMAKVAEFLVDEAVPVLIPRSAPGVVGDQPDDIKLRIRIFDVLPGMLPGLIAAFDAQMIEGDHGHVVSAPTWGEEATRHTTWGAFAGEHATWGDASRGH